MKSTAAAFILVSLDTKESPPKVLGACVASSASITQDLSHRLLVAAEGHGATFEEGLVHLHSQLFGEETRWCGWLVPLLGKNSTDSIREAFERHAKQKAEPPQRVTKSLYDISKDCAGLPPRRSGK